jgi:hypothetical protein
MGVERQWQYHEFISDSSEISIQVLRNSTSSVELDSVQGGIVMVEVC